MVNKPSPSEKIKELQAEIERLEVAALKDLQEQRASLVNEIASIDAEITAITGKAPEGKPRRKNAAGSRSSVGARPDLQELKELLAAAPGKTLNLRKAGLEAANVKTLAAANPHLLKLGGKGAWPEVTLLK